MDTQLIICLVIFALTCAGYMSGVWSLGTVAMLSLSALCLTGCLTAKEALSYFGNNNVIMIGAMSVVAAGFNRTKFCAKLSSAIAGMAKGSLSKVLLLYCVLAMLLSQMVQAPSVVFGIVAPLCLKSAESMGISKSKITLPLGLVAISTCCTLPIGTGATVAAELNGYISSYYDAIEGFTGTMPEVGFFDPMIARGPLLIITVLFCAFIAPKFAPDKADNAETAQSVTGIAAAELSNVAEIAGIVIFFGTALGLMLQASVLKSLQIWQICLLGAVLDVVFGVLTPKEVVRSIPMGTLFLVVGALAMAAALSGTGAGNLIGGYISNIVVAVGNRYVVGLIFFIVPFVLTQFMSNRGTMLIFHPIAIATCYQLTTQGINANPVGLVILVQAACLTAFITPMATATVPYMMEYGNYTQSDLLKGGWLYAVVACVISVAWIMTIYPCI